MRQNAMVDLPKLIFIEPPPHGVLFDMQYELCLIPNELDNFGLND